MEITLLVKAASVEEAKRDAQLRGLNPAQEAIGTCGIKARIYLLNATLDTVQKVADWYAEPSTIIPGKGYPDGTLLMYRVKEEKQEHL